MGYHKEGCDIGIPDSMAGIWVYWQAKLPETSISEAPIVYITRECIIKRVAGEMEMCKAQECLARTERTQGEVGFFTCRLVG